MVIFCVFSEHDWFKIDLPEYLFPSASDVDASVVDTDAIREVCEVCWLVGCLLLHFTGIFLFKIVSLELLT